MLHWILQYLEIGILLISFQPRLNATQPWRKVQLQSGNFAPPPPNDSNIQLIWKKGRLERTIYQGFSQFKFMNACRIGFFPLKTMSDIQVHWLSCKSHACMKEIFIGCIISIVSSKLRKFSLNILCRTNVENLNSLFHGQDYCKH